MNLYRWQIRWVPDDRDHPVAKVLGERRLQFMTRRGAMNMTFRLGDCFGTINPETGHWELEKL